MRKPILFTLLIVTLLLSACGPAIKPATDAATGTGEMFTIALPRIVVDYDLQGNPKVEALDVTAVERLTGTKFGTYLRMPPAYVQWMQTANVQHIELRQAGQGVNILVNALPMPWVSWDDVSLAKTTAIAALITGPGNQVDLQFITRLVPIVRRLGLDLVLRFPRQAPAVEIPLSDPSAPAPPVAKRAAKAASYIVQFEVKYDANGIPAVLGVSAADLEARGIKLGNYRLDPAAIQRLQATNVQSLELRSKDNGFYAYINGDSLPNVVWDDTTLKNAAQVYGQMNDQRNQYVSFVTQMLPQVDQGDVAVLLHFPVAAGERPIAARIR